MKGFERIEETGRETDVKNMLDTGTNMKLNWFSRDNELRPPRPKKVGFQQLYYS